MAAALSGSTLLFLTCFLYTPLLAMNFRTAQAVEGINYVADTLLAASALLMCGSIAGLPEDILGIGRTSPLVIRGVARTRRSRSNRFRKWSQSGERS